MPADLYPTEEGATAEDIAGALLAEDPKRAIDEKLAAVDALEDFTLDEIRKWRHALAIVEAR